ncbi:hypothetical protein EDB89DRAFT_2069334 [Lactarius sanguifluus]|nr:hypothetical protein EDB89DRAFT_2069334 [Lactarius sanguifluus]
MPPSMKPSRAESRFGKAAEKTPNDSDVVVTFITPNHPPSDRLPVATTTLCQGIDYQVSHTALVFSYLSSTLFKLKVRLKEPRQLGGTDDVEWRYLHQFFTAQTLRVSLEFAGHVTVALEG